MNADKILEILDDHVFIDEAKKYLEWSSGMKKDLTIIKLDPEGKTSRKRLYLNPAHGK